MKKVHLTDDDLRRLIEEDDLEVRDRLILHHLAVCPECCAVGGYLLRLFEAGNIDLPLCSLEIKLAQSRAEAPGLWEEIAASSFEEQRLAIRSSPRFRSWGLTELLCERSIELAATDAARGLEVATLAAEIAGKLQEWQPAEQHWLEELRGFAWAHVGNAWRVLGDLRKADDAFETAEDWWESGAVDVGDILGYEGRFWALKASLRRAQRRLPEALELIEQALAAEEKPEDRGRILIKKAKIMEEMGEFKKALSILRKAEGLLGVTPAPRLRLCIGHNRIWLLALTGRHAEARTLLPEVLELSRTLGNDLDLIRLRWVEGQIAFGFGEHEPAKRAFEEVRQEFASRGLGFDAALASLEVAVIYAHEKNAAAVKVIAQEILPLFGVQDIPREAFAVLGLFIQAAGAESLTEEFARHVLKEFRKTRYTAVSPEEQEVLEN